MRRCTSILHEHESCLVRISGAYAGAGRGPQRGQIEPGSHALVGPARRAELPLHHAGHPARPLLCGQRATRGARQECHRLPRQCFFLASSRPCRRSVLCVVHASPSDSFASLLCPWFVRDLSLFVLDMSKFCPRFVLGVSCLSPVHPNELRLLLSSCLSRFPAMTCNAH